jgi:GxxExxY protein
LKMSELIHEELTGKIIEAFYEVYNNLGYGFLEKVYERSLMIELEEMGLECASQKPISVFYEGEVVGEYFADIIVENKVIIELKAAESIRPEHKAQLTNYLRATDIEVGLVLNFGKKPEMSRRLFQNHLKR